jgi:molybdopterin synthase sulfur carrier subunit
MSTRILFFGALREKAGAGERLIELPPDVKNAAALIEFIAGQDDALKDSLQAPSVRIAIDQKLVSRRDNFDAPREIAFMPPFSGG